MIHKLLRGWSLQRGRFTFKFMPLQWYFGAGALGMVRTVNLVLTLGPFQIFIMVNTAELLAHVRGER